jgi:hypothetical protein
MEVTKIEWGKVYPNYDCNGMTNNQQSIFLSKLLLINCHFPTTPALLAY